MTEQLQAPDLGFLDGIEEPEADQAYLEEEGDTDWLVNDSSLEDYSRRASFFRDPDGLICIIRSHIGLDGRNTALDLGAGTNAQALRDLMDSGVVGKALATNYEDRRSDDTVDNARLHHVDGNLTDADTWKRIVTWKERHAPEGFDLIMHRPIAALQYLHPRAYRGGIHAMLDIGHANGLVFAQIPRFIANDEPQVARLCQGIRRRPDVTRIITSPPRSRRMKRDDPDESDDYAVILKRRRLPV